MMASSEKSKKNRRSVATHLHRASLRLLRRLRQADKELEISTARLSALSVLVFIGPKAVGELASIEQVSQPTMTSLIQGLIAQQLVKAESDPEDRRVRRLRPTARGKQLLLRGQQKRIDALLVMMTSLSGRDLRTLSSAAELMEGLLDAAAE